MPHRLEPRTSRPQAGLLLTSPILVLDRDEWLFGCACSGRLPQCVLSVLPSTGVRRPWLWSSAPYGSTTWSLEPFVVGVVIRGLFELLTEIDAALRSGGAKWWPRATRIPARWTCVAACVSLVDDYMFGAVGLVLGFLGSGRLMVMHAGSAGCWGWAEWRG